MVKVIKFENTYVESLWPVYYPRLLSINVLRDSLFFFFSLFALLPCSLSLSPSPAPALFLPVSLPASLHLPWLLPFPVSTLHYVYLCSCMNMHVFTCVHSFTCTHARRFSLSVTCLTKSSNWLPSSTHSSTLPTAFLSKTRQTETWKWFTWLQPITPTLYRNEDLSLCCFCVVREKIPAELLNWKLVWFSTQWQAKLQSLPSTHCLANLHLRCSAN